MPHRTRYRQRLFSCKRRLVNKLKAAARALRGVPLRRAGPVVTALAPLLLAATTATTTAATAFDRSAGNGGPFGLAIGIDALRWRETAELEREFDGIAALGARHLRTDLNWSLVQPDGPGRFDWSGFDRILDLAQARGLAVLPVVGSVPDWALRAGGPAVAPFDVAAFADFVEAAVGRYRLRGVGVWEVWNEPNMTGSWPGAPDAAAYAGALRAAARAIRRADPDATIVSGGLASAVTTGPEGAVTHVAAVDFLAEIYAAGGGGDFDALGFHPYSWPLPPADPAPWSGWTMMTGPIRALMVANGDAGKRIWLTEFGAPTLPGGVSEAEQARILREAADLASGYPWAGPFFWYSYRDLGEEDDPEQHFGLRRFDGTPKASMEAVRALLSEPDKAGPP